jgi:uncharacterized repeat protein (TIGR01451 family)
MNKIQTLWSKFSKRILAVAAISGITVAGALMLNAWGPSRTTYTLAQIDSGALGNNAVLNSIVDENNIDKIISRYNNNHASKITSWVGNETQFLSVKEKGTTSNDEYNGWRSAEPNYNAPQVVEEGKTYRVRMFVHNNNPKGTNVIANNVVAKVNMDDASAQTQKTITAYIQGSNTNQVYDEAMFVAKNGEKFNLAYVPGSVEYVNNWTNDPANYGKYTVGRANGYARLTDNLFAAPGAQLGYSNYNATQQQFNDGIPGCYEYSGWVFFDLVAQFQDAAVGLNKEVSEHGKNTWTESIKVNPGDTVDYQVSYANRGTVQHSAVVIRDILPKGMTYVAGTTKIANSTTNGFINWPGADTLTINGINASIGNNGFNPTDQLSYVVRFSAKVDSNIQLTCGVDNVLTNIARASVTASSKRYYNEDPAKVVIAGPTCPKTADVDPVYICKTVAADKKSIKINESVKFTATPEFKDGLKNNVAVKVAVKGYSFAYGDGSDIYYTDQNVVEHGYTKAGTYVTTAKVQFSVDSKNTEYIGSTDCQVGVNVTEGSTTASTTPKTITSTGAGLAIGSILGSGTLAFGIATALRKRENNS